MVKYYPVSNSDMPKIRVLEAAVANLTKICDISFGLIDRFSIRSDFTVFKSF